MGKEQPLELVGLASGSEFLPLIAAGAACDQAAPGQGKPSGSSNMTWPLQAGLRDTKLTTRLGRVEKALVAQVNLSFPSALPSSSLR